MKVLIIGGVAAGATTAARLRRLNKDVEMIVFEKGNYVSYANCGLPYYVSGEIQGKDDLLLMTPQLFYDRFQIDVRVASEVTAIHPENKSISVYNHMTGETYEEKNWNLWPDTEIKSFQRIKRLLSESACRLFRN